MGLLLQQKGPSRGMPPLQALDCRLSLLIKTDLSSCYLYIPHSQLLHCLYVQVVEYKDSDIIGKHRDLRWKRSNKRDTMQGQICPLIPKPMEQGFQSQDIEKRKWGATLPDVPLDRASPWALPIHLHYPLWVMVHYAVPFAELWLESGSLQNSC